MARRVVMWIAVVALAGLGGVSAASAAIYFLRGDSGWTFYTPYSVTSVPSPLEGVASFCAGAQRVLLPIAACASAAYVYLADRTVLRLHESRGFEVAVGHKSGDV